MVNLGRQEDWSDYMLVEWAAALELHQRGRVKAVLPLLVGETDFWSEAHAAFGFHRRPATVGMAHRRHRGLERAELQCVPVHGRQT
jgi:hypothetical protein